MPITCYLSSAGCLSILYNLEFPFCFISYSMLTITLHRLLFCRASCVMSRCIRPLFADCCWHWPSVCHTSLSKDSCQLLIIKSCLCLLPLEPSIHYQSLTTDYLSFIGFTHYVICRIYYLRFILNYSSYIYLIILYLLLMFSSFVCSCPFFVIYH